MSTTDEVKREPEKKDEEKEKALANSSITNSEDSKLIRARIFVGNLPADLRTEKGEIYDKFRPHGRIMGVSIHNRFSFVQYENLDDAKAAVKAENHSDFRSSRLEIKMALEGRTREDSRTRRRSRSPMDRRGPSRDRDRDRDRDGGRDRRGSSREYYRDSRDSRDRSPPPYVPSPVEERFCHPRTYGANDVEMVVIRKQQGQYADSILRRLYDRRIAANMLFLAEHASLDGAVSEFGRCGTHYVIIIMPKHEETRAITINIFEAADKPREYRNLNVEEGVNLIYRHFRDHYPALARLREMEIQGAGFYPTAPSEVSRALSRLAETCAVPTTSIDAAIRYLQDMRDRTAVAEGLAIQAPQAPVVAYRDPDLGKVLMGGLPDDRGRGLSNDDSVRESLLGLLKATGIVPGLGPVQGAPSAAYNNGASNDYRYAGYGGAQSAGGPSGNSLAEPNLQKALENLVTTGLLRQNPSGPTVTPPIQQQQQSSQQQPTSQQQQQRDNIPVYRTAQGQPGQVKQEPVYHYKQEAHPEENGQQNGGTVGYAPQQQLAGGYAQVSQQHHQQSPQQQQYQPNLQGGGGSGTGGGGGGGSGGQMAVRSVGQNPQVTQGTTGASSGPQPTAYNPYIQQARQPMQQQQPQQQQQQQSPYAAVNVRR